MESWDCGALKKNYMMEIALLPITTTTKRQEKTQNKTKQTKTKQPGRPKKKIEHWV